jgi:hypothetical protein
LKSHLGKNYEDRITLLFSLSNPENLKECYFVQFDNEEDKASEEASVEDEGEMDLGLMDFNMEDDLLYGEGEDQNTEDEAPAYLIRIIKDAKQSYEKLWEKLLKQTNKFPVSLSETILKQMNSQIIPKCQNPLIFGDYLMAAYNEVKSDESQLSVSVHALSALFVLLTKHGLDYPDYYTQLYALVL